MKPNKKYIVIPGMAGEHFISAYKLIKLFGVVPEECITPTSVDRDNKDRAMEHVCYYDGYTMENTRDMIQLRPQEDGDYSLKKATVDHIRDVLTDNEWTRSY